MHQDTTPVTALTKNIADAKMITPDIEHDANLPEEAVPGHDDNEEVKIEEADAAEAAEERRKLALLIVECRTWGGVLGRANRPMLESLIGP